MYCSFCGASVAQGLSYCNYCGAKLSGEKGNSLIKSSGVKPESLVWAMVAVLVFGFVAIVFLMMAMKMVGLNVGQILAFTILSFVIMLLVECVFTWQLLHRISVTETCNVALRKDQTTKELNAAEARALPEHMPSV